MKINEEKIRFVIATRLKREDFLKKSATGKSVMKFIEVSKEEIRLYSENKTGLGELYNRAIDESINKPCILVFIHDGVLITDWYWEYKVKDGLKKFDQIGVVGNTKRREYQPSWIIINLKGNLDNFENLSGAIGQGQNFPPERIDVFGPVRRECKLLDGVFLAARSETLIEKNIRFDTNFKFHFYDMDFCRSCEQLGMRMGTIPLSIIHQSYGSLDESWKTAYDKYIRKWKK